MPFLCFPRCNLFSRPKRAHASPDAVPLSERLAPGPPVATTISTTTDSPKPLNQSPPSERLISKSAVSNTTATSDTGSVPKQSRALTQRTVVTTAPSEKRFTPNSDPIPLDIPELPETELSGVVRKELYALGLIGDTFQGDWGQKNGTVVSVAIKVLRPTGRSVNSYEAREKLKTRLRRQVASWRGLTHPNIMAIYGCTSETDLCLVLPWCTPGNLEQYLKEHSDLPTVMKLRLASEIMQALGYLHSREPFIIHGNLKPSNVLINDAGDAVLSDFQLAKVVENDEAGWSTSAPARGLHVYAAPEILLGEESTRATDVYSFAGLMLLILSGKEPFHEIKTFMLFIRTITAGGVPVPASHPNLPENDPQWELMRSCWTFDAADRPIPQDIVERLEHDINHSALSLSDAVQSESPQLEQPDVPTALARASYADRTPDVFTELIGDITMDTESSLMLGGFADVVRGTWYPGDGEGRPVALKYLRGVGLASSHTDADKVQRMDKRMKRELKVWQGLSHPNILPLYGFKSGDKPCLVSPWCANGNLHDYLAQHPELTFLEKLQFLLQAGQGLKYLHAQSPPIYHGDIKPSNILVNDEVQSALCDFGLAHVLDEMDPALKTSFVGQGTRGYQSPELILSAAHTLPSDVFAFGGLILAVLSGKPPLYKLDKRRYLIIAMSGITPEPSSHPEIPDGDPIWDLMRKCWALDPNARPTIAEVIEELNQEIIRRRGS